MEKRTLEQEQLTARAISHRLKESMEEPKNEAEEKELERSTAKTTRESEEAADSRKAWQEANKRRERVGRTVTSEEIEEQEKFIKKGIKPPEDALSPEKVHELLLAPNSSLQVEVIIEELKKYKKTGAVTASYFAKLESVIELLLAQHKIPLEEGERILGEARQIVIEQMGFIAGGADDDPEHDASSSREDSDDEQRVDGNAKSYMVSRDRFFTQHPEALEKVALAIEKFVSSAKLPDAMSPEDKENTFRDAAMNQVFNEYRASKAPQISNRENIASKYDKHYINAQQALLGEVDSAGNLTGKERMSIDSLREDFESGEIKEFLDVMSAAEERDWTREREEIGKEQNESVFRKKLERLVNIAEDVRLTRLMHERNFNPPNSIQEIAQDIVATDLADYRTGGKYAMFKRVRDENGQERMKFQQNHFIQWARYKMLKWEEDNPDDPQDMFKLVGIFGTTRGVSLSEMILTPGFFRDRDTEEILEDLKLDLIYQAWPWGYIRNSNITYRQAKGNDSDLGPKAIGPIYEQNVLTKVDVLNRMVNMSDVMTEFDPNEKNSKTGQALRMSLMAYHDLTNPVILEKMMRVNGEYLSFFDNKKFLKKYVEGQMYQENQGEYTGDIKLFGDRYSSILFKRRNEGVEALSESDTRFLEEVAGYEKTDPRAAIKRHIDSFLALSKPTGHLFDSEGQLKKDKDGKPRIKDYLSAANIFLLAQPNDPQIKEIRERIRLSIMEWSGIDYDSARWVEAWAYKLAPFTGIASRNDTTSTGFDSYSKTLNTRYYAQHQSHDRRAGAYGNKYTMYQMKRLGMDFYSITTDAGPSILEYIQGGQGDQVDFSKRANVMEFGENTMGQFWSNHVLRSFNEFHELLESKGLKLHEIVNTDPYGRVHYDVGKFNELVRDTFLKNMRYPYSTWGNLDFTEEIMMFEEDVDPKTGLPIAGSTHYVSRPIARHMFGEAMFGKGKHGYDVMLDYEKLDLDLRLKAKRYFQLEKRLYGLPRNQEVKGNTPLMLENLSPEEREKILEARLQNDTDNALTDEEKQFLRSEQGWFYSESLGEAGVRDIVARMDKAFTESPGRQHFWKEAAKVRLAAELKEARKRFGNVQTMMSFEEVEKFLSAIEQLDANVYADEGDFGSPKPMDKVFTKEDIAQIRKLSGTGFLRMALQDVGEGSATGGIEGLWKAFTYLLGNIAK